MGAKTRVRFSTHSSHEAKITEGVRGPPAYAVVWASATSSNCSAASRA